MSKQFYYTIETLLHKLAVIHNFEDCYDFTLKMENNIHKAIKSYIEYYDIQISPLQLVFTDEDKLLRHKQQNVCNNKKNINDNEVLEFVNSKINFIKKTIKRLSKVNNDDNKYKQTESILHKLQIEISEYIKKEISTNKKECDNNKEKIEIQLLPSNINYSFFNDCFTNSNNNNHFNKNDLNKFKSSLFQD
jgi:exonuclease VII large subunit